MADGAGARRIAFLAACRALAVLGMLFANMMNVFLRRVPEVLQHNEGDVLRAFDFPAPVFQFLIGVSLVLFLHKRRTGGLTPSRARLTAVKRFVLLIGLGIVLDSAPALLPMLRLTEGPRWGVLQTLGLGGVVAAGAAELPDGAVIALALGLAAAALEERGLPFPGWLLAVGSNALTAWVLQYVLVYYPAWIVFWSWRRLPLLPGMAAVLATLAVLSALTIALGRRGIRIPI